MQCPVCGMKLFEVKSDGEMEHTDHNPKHGGDFFMASDGWHHVEIALMPGRELRVYVYDNYTKPNSGAHLAKAVVTMPGLKKAETIELKASEGGAILRATLPEDVAFPIEAAVRVAFANARENWMLFNVSYKKFSEDRPGPFPRFTPENMRGHPKPSQTFEPSTYTPIVYTPLTLSPLAKNPLVGDASIVEMWSSPVFLGNQFPRNVPSLIGKPAPAIAPRRVRVMEDGTVREE